MPRLPLCFVVAIVPCTIAYTTVFPRQAIPAVGGVMSTSTSSFNWWPYPAGGVSISTSTSAATSLPVTTLLLVTSSPSSNASPETTSTISSPSSPSNSSTRISTSDHNSPASRLLVTTPVSSPTASPSHDPKSLLKSGSALLNPLWLVPVCLLSGAVMGCAVGWLSWRQCGGKRGRNSVRSTPDGYAWPYIHEPEREPHDNDNIDKDVERGHSRGYLSLGNVSIHQVSQESRRVPSTASTSGARTWVGYPQARKRSGLHGPPQANADGEHGNEDSHDVKSPLLTQFSPFEVHHDSKPLPASPLPSPYSYGDEEQTDVVPYETIRHKSVRRRIWERLGFAEGDLARNKSNVHEEEGRHTWSAGTTQAQDHEANVGRSLTFWGRRKTTKEGRIERWVRGVIGDEVVAGDMQPQYVHHEGAPTDLTDGEKTPPQEGTPELVLSTLRRVSRTAWPSQDFDKDPVMASGLTEPFSPASHQSSPTLNVQSTLTRSGQRRSIRHVEQRPRGVSLQDPGPISGTKSISKGTLRRTMSKARNAFPLRTSTTPRSNSSQRSISNPPPLSPSSVSRYSATPHIPATTLNRSPSRTPARRPACRDTHGRSTPTGAAPSSLLGLPIHASNTTPPTRGNLNGALARTLPSPSHGVHRSSQHRLPTSDLPVGPSSLTSPPLQSALCFDGTLSDESSWVSAGVGVSNVERSLPTSSRPTPRQSSKRASASGSTLLPSASRTCTGIPSRASHQPRMSKEHARPIPAVPTGSIPPSSRHFSPKERHLARQSANAKVEVILSRSYSSRNFDERPTSPTMFGAVIDEEVQSVCLEDYSYGAATHDTLTFGAEDGEGIEQRLACLR